MEKYIVMPHVTTKRNNHLFNGKEAILFADKTGNKMVPVFENEHVSLYATKPGTFCFVQYSYNIFLLQLVRIVREIDSDDYDTSIRELDRNEVHYKGVWCILNTYNGEEWERPLISRIEKYKEFIETSYKEVEFYE